MRSRSNSGVRLDYFQRIVNDTILQYQNPVTGLLPATPSSGDAWVRDNVNSILAVWGLALAYKKNADVDEDIAKAYELEQSTVKLMRGVLQSMMRQCNKLDRFKHLQLTQDALHAKYSVQTGKTCVSDSEWGHLQIDATSLYLLTLAQMTASGLRIIFTLNEVDFVQNLIFYIECAYRIPDYGMWERGDKTNTGVVELNASSIGMAKAAMDAMDELDLFGSRGGPASCIYVLADEIRQCQATLESMLPRESSSKEVDSSLITIISFPAFAVDDHDIVELAKTTIIDKLQGKYGFTRFLRDGYKTAIEDPNRIYYYPHELAHFENIESEWPIFFAYMLMDGLFIGNQDQVDEYNELLESVILRQDKLPIMPEMYSVPYDRVEEEKRHPHSQQRNPIGKIPHMWGQSLYILTRLVAEKFLSPGELDPLNRRLSSHPKPDLTVQVVMLAETESLKVKLLNLGFNMIQTFQDVRPIHVLPAKALSHIYAQLGKNQALGLRGRLNHEIGLLTTSKLYTIDDKLYAFSPQFVDQQGFYIALDIELLLDIFKSEIEALHLSWRTLGRPTIVFPIRNTMILTDDTGRRVVHPSLINTMKKLKTGYIHGTRVTLGKLEEFVSTSCVTKLYFLTKTRKHREDWQAYLHAHDTESPVRHRLTSFDARSATKLKYISNAVAGLVKRTKSIHVERDLGQFGAPTANTLSPDYNDEFASDPVSQSKVGEDLSSPESTSPSKLSTVAMMLKEDRVGKRSGYKNISSWCKYSTVTL